MVNETRVTGRIIKVSKDGWGFISSKEIQFTRIFFHWTALKQDTLRFMELHAGMYVEFTPVQVQGKGYRAVHVRVLDKPPAKQEEHEVDVTNGPETSDGDGMSQLQEPG